MGSSRTVEAKSVKATTGPRHVFPAGTSAHGSSALADDGTAKHSTMTMIMTTQERDSAAVKRKRDICRKKASGAASAAEMPTQRRRSRSTGEDTQGAMLGIMLSPTTIK